MAQSHPCKLEIRNVHKTYRLDGEPVKVLDGVQLVAEPESFVTIIGPSGCGKSTLFGIITGLSSCLSHSMPS